MIFYNSKKGGEWIEENSEENKLRFFFLQDGAGVKSKTENIHSYQNETLCVLCWKNYSAI